MRPIRSLSWDAVWIWSGLPIGVALIWLPLAPVMQVFFVLNAAHLISPMILTWGHGGARQVALERWARFIAIPILILCSTTLLGFTVGTRFQVNPVTLQTGINYYTDWWRPLVWLFPLYFSWNAFHFGAQVFGFTSLYRRGWSSARQRAVYKWGLVVATIIGLEIVKIIVFGFEATGHVYHINGHDVVGVPKSWHLPMIGMFVLGLLAFGHSLQAIGISSHILASHYQRTPWIFVAIILLTGGAGFFMLFHTPEFVMRVTMTAVGFRLGLAFVHFLYESWIYKLSDPQVRAAIGRDLFGAKA
jgi:hypothetical protein